MAAFDTYKFIEEIEKRPALWNFYCKEYDDRKLKRKCWDEIIEIFSEPEHENPENRKILEDALKQRWKSIRGCYSRELKRQKFKKAGSLAGYQTEYVHFKHLNFLKKVIVIKEAKKTASDLEVERRALRKEARKNFPVYTINEIFADPPANLMELDAESRKKEEDKMSLRSFLSKLKEVPKEFKLFTKMAIMYILKMQF